MYICNQDFNLFVEGKCFSFHKGQVFHIEDEMSVKSLLANGMIVEYNYSDPVVSFSRVGVKFHKLGLETK